MTNLERIKTMTTEEYIKDFNSLRAFPFFNYFDFAAYLNGESSNKLDYLKVIGTVKVFPTEMELKNEPNAKPKIYKVLKKTQICGSDYYTVSDIKNKMLMKVPAKYCEWIHNESEELNNND